MCINFLCERLGEVYGRSIKAVSWNYMLVYESKDDFLYSKPKYLFQLNNNALRGSVCVNRTHLHFVGYMYACPGKYLMESLLTISGCIGIAISVTLILIYLKHTRRDFLQDCSEKACAFIIYIPRLIYLLTSAGGELSITKDLWLVSIRDLSTFILGCAAKCWTTHG